MSSNYEAYCANTTKVYGARFCMTRERWDAACRENKPQRRLSDDEFDDEQARIEGVWR